MEERIGDKDEMEGPKIKSFLLQKKAKAVIFLLQYALQKTVSTFAPSFLCRTDYS